MKLPSKSPGQVIKKSLEKLTTEQQTSVEKSLPSFDPLSLVSIDTTKILKKNVDKSFSVRLIKWVEPYLQGGVQYSLFYTEVNHNLKVGDKVFIVGGNYDSETLREKKKTGSLANGYTVLYVDRCKLVLNIPYTGALPTNEEPLDNFTKVYTASDDFEFVSYLNTWSARIDDDYLRSRFHQGTNNFLVLNGTYSITPGQSGITGFTSSSNLSVDPITHGNCVTYIKEEGGQNYLVDITIEFMGGSFSNFLSTTATNNGKVKVMNNDLVVLGQSFKNGYVYSFDGSIWKIDKTFLPVFVTEQNFVNGVFAGGEWNQGLFGRHEEKIEWNGNNVEWNLGTVLNATWNSGVLDSTIEQTESYFTVIDRSGKPQIRANSTNNGGAGYNYVFDTDFLGGDIINGNIYNMATIYGLNATFSQLGNYLSTGVPTYSVNLTSGVYYNSDILSAKVENSTLISSYVNNSYLTNCKSVNSEIESSIFDNSTYLADNVIKIQTYQETNVVWYDPQSTGTKNYKLYKFYLTEGGFSRISEFQNFYFQGLKINQDTTNPLHYWDDKFTLGQYFRSVDLEGGGKSNSQVIIQLSTTEDNRNGIGEIVGASNSLVPNYYPLPSLDVMVEMGPDFNYGSTTSYPRPYLGSVIDISEAYIIEADFISGIFQNSKWVSGNYINYNEDHSLELNVSNELNTSNIFSTTQSFTLEVGDKLRPSILTTDNSGSNFVFINNLKYSDGSSTYSLSDTYQVTGIDENTNTWTLQDIDSNSVIQSLPTGVADLLVPRTGMYSTYLSPVKFINSEFRSGIFVRGYFENCVFYNPNTTTDKTITDVYSLRPLLITDTIFANNNNKIVAATVYNSTWLGGNDIWYGGVFYQSVWDGRSWNWGTQSYSRQSFQGGIFTKSKWLDGDFIGGEFYLNSSNNVDSDFYLNNIVSTSHRGYRWSWVTGNFKGGNFELSNWENGTFMGGNFYNSHFIQGQATGGNFGKSYLNSGDTAVYSGDFTKIKVENANFITDNPITGLLTPNNITLRNSVVEAGIISNNTTLDPSGSTLTTIWESGQFNGGEFTGTSQWKGGEFNGGKFTSYYGLTNAYSTPKSIFNKPQEEYAWQGGEFNGGEFGNALLGTNSTWFTGEFNGGIFQGKYWRNGIFTGGEFNGINKSTSDELWTPMGQIGTNTTDIYSNYIGAYYGYWNDGVVSESKDKFIKDQKLYSKLERESTRKEKIPTALFQNMLWKDGTFSHTEGTMEGSVWLDGIFEDGKFNNSHFNPYLQILNDEVVWDNTGIDVTTTNTFNINVTGPTWLELEDVCDTDIYSCQIRVTNFSGTGVYVYAVNSSLDLITPTSISTYVENDGFYSFTFSTETNFCLSFTGSGTLDLEVEVYPGDQKSGYRLDTLWKGGILNDSYFDFSNWETGEFLSGTATGMIWESGVTEYMNAYNILWLGGTWRNGNWFGSPFKNITKLGDDTVIHPGQTEDIINNISIYLNNSDFGTVSNPSEIHLNNVFNNNGNFYSSSRNNELYSPTELSSPDLGQRIILPTNVNYEYKEFSFLPPTAVTNFGNGQFIKGIWENGSWIDGYREDKILLKSNGFTQVGGKNLAYQTSENEWTIGLDILVNESVDNWDSYYEIGDKVSVGNIVAIDLNGERRLLKDYLLVSNVDENNNTIQLTVNINFPIVSIEWDSYDEEDGEGINPRHLIYITKNVWLNGNFYNGHFKGGVWNNGLINGYPYITEMTDIEWIDGVFKGGHFKGGESLFTLNSGDSSEQFIHTALIQNMEFYDENQRESLGDPLFTFKYNSWIDVVFDTETGVNINKLNTVLGTQLDNIVVSGIKTGIIEEYIENHYYSYATKDILACQAYITNAYDNEQQVYSLGWKYTEYTNFLEEGGVFNEIINGSYNYTSTDQNNGNYVESGDLENFYGKGWTYSNKLGDTTGQGIEANLSSIPQLLKLSGKRFSEAGNSANYRNYNLIRFDNENITIDSLRYSFIETSVSSYLDPSKTYVYFNNYPAPYTVARQGYEIGGTNLFLPINQSIDATSIFIAKFYDETGTKWFELKVGEFSLTEFYEFAVSQGNWSGIGTTYPYNGLNDAISKVEIITSDDQEYEVILYIDDYFGSNSLILSGNNGDTFDLSESQYKINDTLSFNKNTSSIKIRPKKPNVVTKREYFYNKPSLDLTILNNESPDQRWSLYFESIKYVEVDRIPFFDLGGDNVIKSVPIKWGDMNFDNFVAWDEAGTDVDPSWPSFNTWDNLSFARGFSDNNYVNGNIISPTYSLSEKITFDNPNIDYLS